MTITFSTLATLADLSVWVYRDSNRPLPTGWQVLSQGELNTFAIPGNTLTTRHSYSWDGIYTFTNFINIDLQAMVAINVATKQLALVFRGTAGAIDVLTDIQIGTGILFVILDEIRAFTSAVEQFARTEGYSAFVAGHSLGGALAELLYAQDQASSDRVFVGGLGLGSPGFGPSSGTYSGDGRFIHVAHTADAVGALTYYQSHISNSVMIDDDSFGWSDVFTFQEHSSPHYRDNLDRLAQSPAFQNADLSTLTGNYWLQIADPSQTYNGGPSGSYTGFLGSNRSDNYDGSQSGFRLRVEGAGGSDTIRGGSGNDILSGGDYGDYIYGGGGADTIYGGSGIDDLRGDAGVDTIYGGTEMDFIYGGTETDHLYGDGGWDTLRGEGGNDFLYGGLGRDTLYGDQDNDTLEGGAENDTIQGGPGSADTAVFRYQMSYYQAAVGSNPANFQLTSLRGEEGVDTLVDVEFLKFADQTISVTNFLARFTATPTSGTTGSIAPIAVAEPTVVIPPASVSGPPKLYFNSNAFSEGNSGSRTAYVEVYLDKASSSPVTFRFNLSASDSQGFATSGQDFEAINSRLFTIPAGQTSVRIPITILGDTRVEGNEKMIGAVTSVQGAVLANGSTGDVEILTIIDDDVRTVTTVPTTAVVNPPGPVYLTIRQGSVLLQEGPAGTQTVFEFSIRRTGDLSVSTRFELEVDGYGAAPASPDDFVGGTYPSVRHTFNPGEDRYTFEVRVQGDATNEAHEYFEVYLRALTSGVNVIENRAIGSILNDDGSTPLPPSGSPVQLSIEAVDAEKAEGTNVDSSGSPVGYTIYTFRVTRTGDLSQVTTVDYRAATGIGTTPQSDTRDMDYLTRTLTFQPGEQSKIIEIRIRPDNSNEPDEPLVVRISPDSATPNVIFARREALGLIINDDGPDPALITPQVIAVTEGSANRTVMFRIELSHTMPVPVSMTYIVGDRPTSDYPATAGSDFVAATGTITIPAGQRYVELPVGILADANPEDFEAIVIRLSDPVNGYFGRSLSDWDSGIVIIDDDGPNALPTTPEGLAAAAIDLGTLAKGDERKLFLHFDNQSPFHVLRFVIEEPLAFTTFGQRPDFLFDASGRLVAATPSVYDEIEVADIANGFNRGMAFQPGTYYFVVHRDAGQADGTYDLQIVGAPAEGELPVIWVRHIDSAGQNSGIVNEGAGFAYARLSLTAPSEQDITVTLEFRPVNATEGADYRPWRSDYIISAGSTNQTVTFDVFDDSIFEQNEQFEIAIVAVQGAILPSGRTEYVLPITIIDNDEDTNPAFSIEGLVAERAEGNANGGTFQFLVTRPLAHAANAGSVSWSVIGYGGDPADGNDFANGNLPIGVVSFAAGETSKIVTFSVAGDRRSEGDESFEVVLSSPSAGMGLGFATATGVIRNDDGQMAFVALADGTIEVGISYELSLFDHDVLLSGGAAASLWGNELDNLLSGNNAANLIVGAGGLDKLFGYAGDDRLEGNDGNDELFGGAGADDLYGGSGANLLVGGTGNDRYFVDDANDVVDENTNEGADKIFASIDYWLAENVEELELIGSARRATGNDGQNGLFGNDQDNEIFGLGGDDSIGGAAGADWIDGGDGNDTIDGGSGINSLLGGNGNDRLIVGSAGSGSNVDGGANTDTLAISNAVSLGSIASIEAIDLAAGAALTLTGTQFSTGLALNSAITGSGNLVVNMSAGVNFFATQMSFAAGVGVTVNGTSGIDVIKAALGAAISINGGDGIDQIRGGNLVDTIDAGVGNDKIMGLGGADVLTGGTGADQFRFLFTADSGLGAADQITDFAIGTDLLDFRALDSNPVTPGIQGFSFVGTSAFSGGGAAQLRYLTSGSNLIVQGDVNGDGTADMEIVLQGLVGQTLTAAQFMLGTPGQEPLSAKDAAPPVMDPLFAAAKLPAEGLATSDPLLSVRIVDPFSFPDHGLDRWATPRWDLLPLG